MSAVFAFVLASSKVLISRGRSIYLSNQKLFSDAKNEQWTASTPASIYIRGRSLPMWAVLAPYFFMMRSSRNNEF